MPDANAPVFHAQRAWKDALDYVAKELATSKVKVRQRYMPRWWDETMLSGRGDYLEAILMLASGLQVSAKAIEERLSPLLPQNVPTCCKGSSTEKLERQTPARRMAEALARNLVGMLEREALPVRKSASELRAESLAGSERITLDGLLGLCWKVNVPVAHLADAPSPMPHAIATNVDGRCAIVLLRNKKHSGWILFDLAHELGHIMLGHVAEGESHSDGEEMDPTDAQEAEANEFAMVLLTGQPIPLGYDQAVPADKLVRVAKEAASELRVDPQWLIVTTGESMGNASGLDDGEQGAEGRLAGR